MVIRIADALPILVGGVAEPGRPSDIVKPDSELVRYESLKSPRIPIVIVVVVIVIVVVVVVVIVVVVIVVSGRGDLAHWITQKMIYCDLAQVGFRR